MDTLSTILICLIHCNWAGEWWKLCLDYHRRAVLKMKSMHKMNIACTKADSVKLKPLSGPGNRDRVTVKSVQGCMVLASAD